MGWSPISCISKLINLFHTGFCHILVLTFLSFGIYYTIKIAHLNCSLQSR
ncbi:protein of unknown function [Latilactobacillus sakei]|nr:protein of unknown function [Latilactobacillus sakei]